MSRNVSLAEFGRLAGITRQAVYNLVKRGSLIQSRNGNINLDNPQNKQWLEDRDSPPAAKPKPAPKPKPESSAEPVTTPPTAAPLPRRNQYDPPEGRQPEESLDRMAKKAKVKRMVKDIELQEVKLALLKGDAFSRAVAQGIFAGVTGRIVSTLSDLSASIVDRILDLRVTNPADEREQLVRLLRDTYTEELRSIVAEYQRKL